MITNRITLLISLLYLLTLGCEDPKKPTNEVQTNIGHYIDTIIDGVKYRMTLKESKDTKGKIERMGYYIKGSPVGKHCFYKNSRLYAIKYFAINDRIIKRMVASNEYYSELFYDDIDTALTRLNREMYFDSGGDTLRENSNYAFIEMDDRIVLGDTLKIHLKYNFDNNIVGSEINLRDSYDTSFFYIMFFEGEDARIAYKPKSAGSDTLIGICYLQEKNVNSKEELYRILSFRIPYTVISNRQSLK